MERFAKMDIKDIMAWDNITATVCIVCSSAGMTEVLNLVGNVLSIDVLKCFRRHAQGLVCCLDAWCIVDTLVGSSLPMCPQDKYKDKDIDRTTIGLTLNTRCGVSKI